MGTAIRNARPRRVRMVARAVVGCIVASAAATAFAQGTSAPPGYSTLAPTGVVSPVPPVGPAPTPVPNAEIAALAGAAYLGYVQSAAIASALASRRGGDPSAYFTNGAAATSVPTDGQPGAAYFSNGAEVTALPLTSAMVASPAAPSAAPSASASAEPTNVTDAGATPTTAPPTATTPTAAPTAGGMPTSEAPSMSWSDWVRSIAAWAPAAEPASLPNAGARAEAAPVVPAPPPPEPGTANAIPARATVPPPAPSTAVSAGGHVAILPILGGVGAALLLGAIALVIAQGRPRSSK